MFVECLSMIAALGLVTLGVLVMIQAVSLEDIAQTLGRALLPIALVAVLICSVKPLLVALAAAALWLLRRLIVGLAVAALASAALWGMARIGAWVVQSRRHERDRKQNKEVNREKDISADETSRF
jgi:hypothetical protein